MQPSVSAGHGPALSHRGRRSPWLRRAIVFVTCAVLADALFGDRGLAERMKLLQDY